MSDVLAAIYRGDRDEAERLAGGKELDVFEAAALGRSERLEELLDGDASLANAWADDGFQPLDMAALLRRERHAGKQTADLRRIVVLDRRLEVFARRRRLLELAAKPAQETHLRTARHSGSRTVSVSPSSSTEPPSARMTRTAT